jgi:hypothetical protein
MERIHHLATCFSARTWHCCKASWAFWVNLSSRNIWIPQKNGAGRPSRSIACPQPLDAATATTYYIDATFVGSMRYTAVSILICRGLAVSFLVRVTVSTPFL